MQIPSTITVPTTSKATSCHPASNQSPSPSFVSNLALMASGTSSSRKRRASGSPTGSTSSRLSEKVSNAKDGVKTGFRRTVNFFRSLSCSRFPSSAHPASVRRTSSQRGSSDVDDDLLSTKSAASSDAGQSESTSHPCAIMIH